MSDLTPEQRDQMRARHETIVRQRRVSPDDADWLLRTVPRLLDALDALLEERPQLIAKATLERDKVERQRDDALGALREIEYLADTGTPLTDILLYTREARERIQGGE